MRLKAILFAAAMIPSTAMAQAYGSKPDTQPSAADTAPTQDSKTGLTVTQLSAEQRKSLGVPGDGGLLVKKVEPGSPAAAAGIKEGDVITKLEKTSVKVGSDLTGAAPAEMGKKTLSIELIRDKKPMTLQISAMTSQTPDATAPDKATPDTQMPSDQNQPSDQKAPTGPSDMSTPQTPPTDTHPE
jgi:serine protease Do